MGVSTNAIICFGISFEADYHFRWDNKPYKSDIEKWWVYKVHGYIEPFKVFNDKGNWLDKTSRSKYKKWRNHRKEFEKTIDPLPIEIVKHCSSGYPMYIISVKDTELIALRGDPTPFNPKKLTVSEEDVKKLIDFCRKYCMPIDSYSEVPVFKPKWYLCSDWS